MAYNVSDIANKILEKGTKRNGELISNMKLQKLLYYVQGFNLAAFDTPLFDDEVEAWMYGPVIPSVYNKFKNKGNGGIVPESNIIELSKEEEHLFNEVIDMYNRFSAIGLMEMTHKEEPWKTTTTGKGNIISKDNMKRFFKTRLA